MSSGESTQSTQSQSVNQIPQWVTNAGQQNYSFAQNVANQPLTQYQGQMVAGVSPQTQQAWNLAASSGNVGQDQYGASQAGYLNSLGQTPQQVTDPGNASSIRANQLSNTNLSPYMNPFTSSVINTTMPIYQQALGAQQVGNQNQASGANAFGGSRMGVQQGVTQAQGAQGMAQMASGLNQANFQQAQAAAQGDVAARNQIAVQNQNNQQANLNRNLQAQTTNQGAAQAKINSDILASQGLANLGDSQQKANAANFTMLSQAGAGQAAQQQDQINAQMAKFTQAANYPQQQLATLLSALGMTPHDTATAGSQQTRTQTPTNWGALALGGLEDLSGFFKPGSDKGLKTDVERVGKDQKTDLPMYAFRYKGDPKTYPKVVGPMAQDVEKKFPGATQKTGGKLTVDPSIMAASGVQGYAEGTENVQPDPTALAQASQAGGLTRQPSNIVTPRSIRPDPNSKWLEKYIGPNVFSRPGDYTPVQSFAAGVASVPKIPGALAGVDSVPSLLTPGEAVLNQQAATRLGRGTIKQLNMGTPPSSPLVAAGLKPITAGKTLASFMPPKRAFHAAVTAPRGGAKALGGMSNTKVRGALA